MQNDIVQNNGSRNTTRDSLSLSDVRFDFKFPRYIIPHEISLGTQQSSQAIFRNGFEVHTRLIVVDVSQVDDIIPWNFQSSPSSGDQPIGSYPQFYAPSLAHPRTSGGAPLIDFETINDNPGSNKLLVCRDISDPDEVMPLPHNSRNGVRILSDRRFVRRCKLIDRDNIVYPTEGAITGETGAITDLNFTIQSTGRTRSYFQIDALNISVNLPWYKRIVEYKNPMFFQDPELPPTDPPRPEEDLRSLLGETFICIENWVVPVGEHTHEVDGSNLGNYVWLDHPASSFENMPHILA